MKTFMSQIIALLLGFLQFKKRNCVYSQLHNFNIKGQALMPIHVVGNRIGLKAFGRHKNYALEILKIEIAPLITTMEIKIPIIKSGY